MKKMIKMLWITLIMTLSCNALAGPNQDIGTVVGGIAGGIIGNNMGHGSGRAAATIGGAVIGSLVGNQVGSSADAEQYYRGPYNRYPCGRYYPCERYSHWDSYRAPCGYYSPRFYPPRYSNTFIGRDGRLCRNSVFINDCGDRIYATFCCYHMSSDGYCTRWVRVR